MSTAPVCLWGGTCRKTALTEASLGVIAALRTGSRGWGCRPEKAERLGVEMSRENLQKETSSAALVFDATLGKLLTEI